MMHSVSSSSSSAPGYALASLMHSVQNVRTVQHESYMCEQVEAPIFLFNISITMAKTLKK